MNDTLQQWFSMTFLDLFQSQIRHYQTSVTDRLLPTLTQLEKESEEFERRETQRLESIVDPEMDYADFTEIIHDKTIDYYISLSNVRQGVLNLLTTGLFHLFEQQVSQFVYNSANKLIDSKRPLVRFAEILEEQNCKVRSLPHWDMLRNELRLVANTVKHGPGDSANELAERRPDLFRPEYIKTYITFEPRGGFAISPVAGEGLFLTTDDFQSYASSIIEFWNAFSCLNK